ncbi:DNA-directed DNA polymerase [Tanacetum coccineum]
MPKYAKFLKGLLTNKARLEEACMITINERCSAVLLNKLPSKEKDPGSFTIPCDTGQLHINNALADLAASISLMPYTMYENLGLGEPKATRMSLELADRSIQYPSGIIENLLIKVDKFVLLIDFVILDIPEDSRVLLLQGFDIEIKDKRGAENLDADHLLRLRDPGLGTFIEEEIADEFPNEHLMVLKTELNNNESCASVTGRKVYESGFFWPSIFKDAKDYVMRCDACQRSGNISSRSEMPQNNIQFREYQIGLGVITFWGGGIETGLINIWLIVLNMIDVVDVSDLKLTVGHPNGTLAKITHVGNLKLNNDVILFNVLVIHDYTDLRNRSSGDCLYDDEEGPSGRDGGVHQPDLDGILGLPESGEQIPHLGFDLNIHQPGHDGLNTATPLGDNDESEGNVDTSEQVPIFQNVFENQTEEVNPGLKRSSRSSKFPTKLNEYVLNKSSEPSSFEEASKDPNCINAMNDEMHC